MRVPQLFHLLVGGGVVQPSLVERLDFYPGSYDASFGRYAGGIIDAETRAARRDGHHLDAQLRVYDVARRTSSRCRTAWASRCPARTAGRRPHRLVPRGHRISYGDYQLRLDWKA